MAPEIDLQGEGVSHIFNGLSNFEITNENIRTYRIPFQDGEQIVAIDTSQNKLIGSQVAISRLDSLLNGGDLSLEDPQLELNRRLVSLPIVDTGLDIRTLRPLRNAQFTTVGDLMDVVGRENAAGALLSIRNFGKVTLKNMLKMLIDQGVTEFDYSLLQMVDEIKAERGQD